MTIFARHPYSFLFAGSGVVLIVILFSIQSQATPAASTSYVSGGNTPTYLAPVTNTPAQTSDSNALATPTPLPITFSFPTSQATEPATTATAPDFLLTSQNSANTGGTSNTSLSDLLARAYAYVPTGFSLPLAPAARTPAQAALYQYGNSAGAILLGFENTHADMSTTLQTWIGARSNSSAQAAVRQIAADMNTAGQALAALPNVPTTMVAANQSLATHLQTAASNLQAVVDASGSDTALGTTMQTYDTSADAFTTSFLSISDVLSSARVSFSSTDAGSVFEFSSAGSL